MNRRLLELFVQDVLRGDRPLQGLQELILEILWDRRDQESAEVIDLAERLDLKIAEFTGGYIPFEALKGALRREAGLNVPVVKNDDSLPAFQWGSSTQTTRQAAARG